MDTKKIWNVSLGCYERCLFGFDFSLEDEKVELESRFVTAAHEGCIKTVSFDGRFLVTGSTDQTSKIFDIIRKKEVGVLFKHESAITSIQSFQKHLFTASEDTTIVIWRIHDWEPLKTLSGHKASINCVSIHPSGKVALSSSKDGTLKMWNLIKGKIALTTKLDKEAEVVLWSQNGDHFALICNNKVLVYESTSSEPKFVLDNKMRVHSIAFMDKDTIASAGEDCSITFWDIKDGKQLKVQKIHDLRVKGIQIVPSTEGLGVFLLSISTDGFVKLWKYEKQSLTLVAEKSTDARLTCISCNLYKQPKIKEANTAEKRKETGEKEEEAPKSTKKTKK